MKDYININEIEEEGILEGTLNYKPITAICIVFAFALGLLLLKMTVTTVLAIILILVGLAGLFLVKDSKVMDAYNDSLIFYDVLDNSKAIQLKREEISSWAVDAANNRIIVICGEDGYRFQTFRFLKAYNLLNKAMPDKMAKSTLEKWRNRKNEKKTDIQG